MASLVDSLHFFPTFHGIVTEEQLRQLIEYLKS